MEARKRIIAVLDVDSAEIAREIVTELRDEVGAFKIGLQLFTAAGPTFVRELTQSGVRVFLDLKYHDIPNTVACASVEAARLGVWMFNMHALGGREMMSNAVKAVDDVCAREGLNRPLLIGVTILTSSDQGTLNEVGIGRDVADEVLKLAQLTAECGLDGIVASPREVEMIRGAMGTDFVVVTPGIRPAGKTRQVVATSDDQKRVTNPSSAVAAGSDYLVIGRPILQAADRRDAVRQIVEEIQVNQ